jgi:hypothetical protein
MKTYWGMEVYLYAFLTLALDGCEWSLSRSGRFAAGITAPVAGWIRGWVGPTAGLDAVEMGKIPIISPARNRTPDPYADEAS